MPSVFIYYINKSTKNGACLDSSQLIVFGRRVFAHVVAKQNVNSLSKRDCVVSIISYSRKMTLTLKISTVTRSQIQNLFGSWPFLSFSCYTL